MTIFNLREGEKWERKQGIKIRKEKKEGREENYKTKEVIPKQKNK
jgi:hypothetical protein